MGSKLRDLQLEAKAKFPGPSNYEIAPLSSQPTAKFGSVVSRASLENVSSKEAKAVPGPGSYQISLSPIVEQSPRFGFSSAARSVLDNRNVPGPGSY